MEHFGIDLRRNQGQTELSCYLKWEERCSTTHCTLAGPIITSIAPPLLLVSPPLHPGEVQPPHSSNFGPATDAPSSPSTGIFLWSAAPVNFSNRGSEFLTISCWGSHRPVWQREHCRGAFPVLCQSMGNFHRCCRQFFLSSLLIIPGSEKFSEPTSKRVPSQLQKAVTAL